jgi:nucleoside-diphosphate-sugar epimerase
MILVTGGTGFIGSHLLYHLIKGGAQPKALKRESSSTELTRKIFSYYEQGERMFSNIEWITGDLLDYYSLTDAMAGVKQVYHTAAVVSFRSEDKESIVRVNVQGTSNIVNAALESGIDKFCFVSSIGALGRAVADGVVTESSEFVPSRKNSVYSTTKYEAEREVWRGIAEGLDAVIVNPSIVVGPGDWGRGSPQMFQTMADGLKFYTSGTNGFIDVNDVARIMIKLMEGPYTGERYILSTENVPYKKFFEWVASAMDLPAPRYKAGPKLSSIGWRLLKAKGWVTGKHSSITRETATTANQQYSYSNEKLLRNLPVELTPIKESVTTTAMYYLKDKKSN